MNNSQIEIKRILSDMDQLQTERRPLQPHFAVSLDVHTRECYATMLSALILADGAVSESANRLLKMLLASIGMGEVRAKLFELAHALEQESIKEFCRVVDAGKLQRSFILDSLILCRIDGPLSVAKSQLLSELIELIGLPETLLPELVHLASEILGVPTGTDLPANWDLAPYSAWDEFRPQELSAEAIKSGIIGGYWKVSKNIELQFPWSIENANISFVNGVTLTTKTSGNVTLKNCRLFLPLLNFEGEIILRMEYTHISGKYLKEKNFTAITINGIKSAIFDNLLVKTYDARAFFIQKSRSNFMKSSFIDCGNIDLVGGAIAADWVVIEESEFLHCKAKLAGGVFVEYLVNNSIIRCNFLDCISTNYGSTNRLAGGAIFAIQSVAEAGAVNNCKFISSNVQLGNCYQGTSVTFCKDSQFYDSNLAFHSLPSHNWSNSGCTFSRGSPTDEKLSSETWWRPW